MYIVSIIIELLAVVYLRSAEHGTEAPRSDDHETNTSRRFVATYGVHDDKAPVQTNNNSNVGRQIE